VIAHVVLFRPRPDLPVSDRRALTRSFERALSEIESVRTAQVGRRTLHGAGYETSADNYSHVAILQFDDLAGLHAYLQHSAHSAPARAFFEAAEATQIFDFELVESDGIQDTVEGWFSAAESGTDPESA
jgi:hypothetical protein